MFMSHSSTGRLQYVQSHNAFSKPYFVRFPTSTLPKALLAIVLRSPQRRFLKLCELPEAGYLTGLEQLHCLSGPIVLVHRQLEASTRNSALSSVLRRALQILSQCYSKLLSTYQSSPRTLSYLRMLFYFRILPTVQEHTGTCTSNYILKPVSFLIDEFARCLRYWVASHNQATFQGRGEDDTSDTPLTRSLGRSIFSCIVPESRFAQPSSSFSTFSDLY
ncbi:uncharacterized protein LAESUDRAFT_35530 [Laetiporus sulphureus 93-53]|uniref:Uncharacterized protein n=1 Tax=Laetiporus sulphureus 93-53 TaxID=1314785 RepID=A0A165IKX2_9APHY|nr:uncharacterized protein LAESUDRAFT_35530 [Laetiporus sulphureus 93-53]KZT13220.1 hypothetical protein LAESUDRAFT_35530 [Laetiporus sulphureus 93-53]